MLKGVGVGDKNATVAAAAMTWMLKGLLITISISVYLVKLVYVHHYITLQIPE